MSRRIALERPTNAIDAAGSTVATWVEVDRVWAEVIPVGARERVAAPQVLPEQTSRFRIRYRTDVEASWRIIHEGKPWAIQGISEIGRHEGTEMLGAAVG